MAILLSSANSSVLTRWTDYLNGYYETKQVQSLSELNKMYVTKKFDVILLHRTMIDIPAFARLIKTLPMVRFFLLSDRPDEDEAMTFLRLGIVGYGNTYISPPRLIEALRVIANGGVWLGQKIIQRLIMDTAHHAKEEDKKDDAFLLVAKLTKSQRKIAELVARGQSNLEIAANLKITERTVKAHLTSIYEKTKTGNRLNLALLMNLGKNPSVKP
ncbi:MAG: response regulator transcription factor [Syntrophaceae bacterium]|nr:response regulator transcription factor [Syntrophaceae bacterium]